MPYITKTNNLAAWSYNTEIQTYSPASGSDPRCSILLFTTKAKDGSNVVEIAKVTQNAIQRFFSDILPCHFATIVESKKLAPGCVEKKDYRAVAIKVAAYLKQKLFSFISSMYKCFPLDVNLAAIKIQANWRANRGRRAGEKLGLLSHILFIKSKEYTQSKYQGKLEFVDIGRTAPQLPPGTSTVLKASVDRDSLSPEQRIEKANQVRQICRKKGYEHLTVPAARLYRKTIIEKRLPIPSGLGANALIIEQLGFYKEKAVLFTDAVKEFAKFSLRYSLSDVVGNANFGVDEMLVDKKGVFYHIPRYDNLPLYIDDEGKGKLGLIDLEDFNPKKKPNVLKQCIELITLFPLHYNEIVSIAKKHGLKEADIPQLQLALERAKQFMYLAYEQHESWMKSREITIESPTQILKLTPTQLSKFSFPEDYSSFNKPEIISKLFDQFYLFLKETLEEKIKKRGNVTNYQQLVALRMIDNGVDDCSLNLEKYEKMIMKENGMTLFQARGLRYFIVKYLVENDLLIEGAKGLFQFF